MVIRDRVVTEFSTSVYFGSKTNPEITRGKIKYS